MKYLRDVVPENYDIDPTFHSFAGGGTKDRFPVHQNKSIPTLKHLAANGPSHTMKFYISSSSPDATMYSGDSQYHTHNSMGARASQIQGAITHHPEHDEYRYQAWHSRDGKNVETTHPKLDNMEKHGVIRGKWNSDEARVEK
jgi:hypothetical protein